MIMLVDLSKKAASCRGARPLPDAGPEMKMVVTVTRQEVLTPRNYLRGCAMRIINSHDIMETIEMLTEKLKKGGEKKRRKRGPMPTPVQYAKSLDRAAKVGVNFIGGFGAGAQGPCGDKRLIECPRALAETDISLLQRQYRSTKSGTNRDFRSKPMGQVSKARDRRAFTLKDNNMHG